MHPPVTGRKRLREDQGQQPHQEASDGRLDVVGNPQSLEEVSGAVEDRRLDRSNDARDDPQKGVAAERDRLGKVNFLREIKNRRPSRKQPVEGIRDHGSNDRINQSLGLEGHTGVEDLDREDSHPQRRFENRRQARSHSRDDQQAAFFIRQAQKIGQDRADPDADLRRGAFASSRTAGTDGHGGCNGFHRWDNRPNPPAFEVESLHRGVGPMALGLRGQRVDEDSGDQAAQRRRQRDQPQPPRAHYGGRIDRARLRRDVAGDSHDQKLFSQSEKPSKELSGEPTDKPNHDGEKKKTVLLPRKGYSFFCRFIFRHVKRQARNV